MGETCETCRFSLVHEAEGGALHCHRYPPQVLSFGAWAEEYWPCVSHDDFCGEYQPHSTGAAKP